MKNPKVRIRNFQREDAEHIVKIHEIAKESFEDIEMNSEFIINSSLRNDFRFFIATIDDEVVGFIGTLFYENVGRAEIGPIGIDDKYKNLGIGTNLVEHALEFLKEKNIHRVIARVKAENKIGLKFFEELDFKFEAYLKRYTKKCEDVVQMVRFLPPHL